MSASAWLRAARMPFLSAVAIPVVLGGALAFHETGTFDGFLFYVTLSGALLIHAGANLMNEHADHVSGADRAAGRHTLLSGGSGVIQSGALGPGAVLMASLFCLACGVALGLYLNAVARGNVVLLLGALGVLLAWGYSERPIQLGYRGRGLGEVTVGVAFGPLPVLGAYYVQTGTVSASALAASVPVALLVALVLLVNGFPDLESDSSVGKRTFVVTFGKEKAIVWHHLLLALVYGTTGLLLLAGVFPAWCLVSFLTLPLAWRGAHVLRSAGNEYVALARAGGATVALHALFGLLLVAGLLIEGSA